MSEKIMLIQPNDVLMFRDGSPFNQGDAGASQARSLFPPPPPTIVGAIRLGLAQQLGFSGKAESWPEDELGNGVNWQCNSTSLGKLKFGALLLALRKQDKMQVVYPLPLHVAGTGGNDDFHPNCFLSPPMDNNGKQNPLFTCDQSSPDQDVAHVSAPANKQGVAPLEHAWCTTAGMDKILKGKLPGAGDIFSQEDLFKVESHVGIGVDPHTRRVNDGQLYTSAFLRLHDQVCLAQPFGGLGRKIAPFDQRFGGEHRFARFSAEESSSFTQASSKPFKARHYVGITIAPTWFRNEPVAGGTIDGLEGKLVTAILPKPYMLGGWNSMAGSPIPMRQVVPAGCVFFMCCDGEKEIAPKAIIGAANDWGFGHCLLGKWPETE